MSTQSVIQATGEHSAQDDNTLNIVATLFSSVPASAAAGDAQDAGRITPPTGLSEECVLQFAAVVARITPSRLVSWKVLEPGASEPRVVEVQLALQRPVGVRVQDLRQHADVTAFEQQNSVSVAAIQSNSVFRTHKRLAVFDMDSTLIQQEVIDEIARKVGVVAEVSAITARAMNGELDFTASLRARCRLLAGVPSDVFEELKSVITLTPGAADLVRALKRLGFRTAVLSGGFTPLASWLAGRLGLDYAHANHLTVSADGRSLTGDVEGDIVHAERKREHVLRIAKENGISLDQVLVVGDGANDLPMMGVAGLGVAFNAKPKVQLAAPAKVNADSLLDVLYLLGFTKTEVAELLQVM